jgi:hypothetical protein
LTQEINGISFNNIIAYILIKKFKHTHFKIGGVIFIVMADEKTPQYHII